MQLGSDSAPPLVIAPAEGGAQAGMRLDFPGTSRSRVFELGSYVRAYAAYGSIDYRLCLWAWDGTVGGANKLLGRSAVHTVSSAAVAPANLIKVTWPLEEPVEVAPFAEVLVGVAWETDPARRIFLGGSSGTGHRYRKDLADGSTWPVSMKDSIHLTDHDLFAWVEDYQPADGIWVYRGGEWTELPGGDAFLVQRGGLAEPAAVRVRRSGAWVTVRPPGG